MIVSITSDDYAKKQLQNQIRNYKKLDKEKTYNRQGTNHTKRKHTRQKELKPRNKELKAL